MARVLVIDDLATMRDLIRRVLRGSGHEVDVAGTVAQAQSMEPAGYDVLLIDEHLGADRGTDLIVSLAAADPAAAARCVLITGGLTGEVPAGATVLAKPFDPAGLRQLVDAVARGGSIGSRVKTSKEFFGEKDLRGLSRSAQASPGQAQTATPNQWRPVQLISRLRAHDYAVVADLIHDGPAQELGASILALELIRRETPPDLASRLDEVIGWLATAGGSMREVSSGPAQRVLTGLADAMPAQVRLVDAEGAAGPGDVLRPSEQVAVVTIAELLVEAIAQPGLACEMTLENRKSFFLIELKIFCDCADGEYLGVLESAAGMFGGSAESGPGAGEWLVRIDLPRLAGQPSDLARTSTTRSCWDGVISA